MTPGLRGRLVLAGVACMVALTATRATLAGAFESPPRNTAHAGPDSRRVASIAVTVADLERSMAWYSAVLDAEPGGVQWLEGDGFERLTGVFGARARSATLRIGSETIELVEFLAPRGRDVPPDSRSNDRWFQHVAIIVRDMDEAYGRLRAHGVDHASPRP